MVREKISGNDNDAMSLRATRERPLMEARLYQASLLWTVNLFAAPVLGFGGAALFETLNWFRGDPPGVRLLLFETGCWGISLLAYLSGNLSVLWPYAVEVDPRAGITLFGPLKKLRVPVSEIGGIEHSAVLQGYVVNLTKPRAALTCFIIPWYFGSQRVDLMRALDFTSQLNS